MTRLFAGGVFLHPQDGVIYITDGAYSINNRVSNMWYWKKVGKDGKLSKTTRSGYGGQWPQLEAEVVTTVTYKLPEDNLLR